MFDRCRATVLGLSTSAAATSRLERPAATSASTSASRPVSPPGSAAGPRRAAIPPASRVAPEAPEHHLGRVQLPHGGVGVAQRLVGPGQQQPDPGGVVGGVQLPPAPAGRPQGRQGRLGPPAGQQHRPPGLQRRRLQARAAVGGGGPGQLVAGPPGRLGVPGGQGDLDLGGAEPGPAQAVVGDGGQGGPDRGRGRRRPALGEAQQGQARLGVAAELVGVPVGRLGPGQVAAEPADVAELVVALGGAGDVQVGQVPADQGGLPLGLGPVAPALAGPGSGGPGRCR